MKTLKKKSAREVSLLLLGMNPVLTLIPALMLGVDVHRQSYEDLLAGKRLPFKAKTLNVMFFFPYKFWDTHCEIEGAKALYGVEREIYLRFSRFWKRVERKIRATYPDKTIRFIIQPNLVYVDRDKILTHDLLAAAGVRTTKTIAARKVKDVLTAAGKDRGIFVKSRYGAEGKGITRIRKDDWITNYARNGHTPANHGISGKWPFLDITDDTRFLQRLLDKDVIVEHEILCAEKPKIGKFDVRVNVVGTEVVHMFVRHAGKGVTTNWSQGGTVEHDYAKILTPAQIASAASEAKKAAKVLGAEFIGVDCMFDREAPNDAIVVEAQCMCDFPKPEACNLGEKLVRHVIAKS